MEKILIGGNNPHLYIRVGPVIKKGVVIGMHKNILWGTSETRTSLYLKEERVFSSSDIFANLKIRS